MGGFSSGNHDYKIQSNSVFDTSISTKYGNSKHEALCNGHSLVKKSRDENCIKY